MKTVADLIAGFEKWDKPALIYKTGYRTFTRSYRQLHQDVLRTAAFLDQQGLNKDDKLIIWGYNCPEWGTVFLAAALKGVVVVPVDFLATADFVEKVHAQVKAKAIFHSEFKLPPVLGVKDFVLDHLSHYLEGVAPAKPNYDIKPQDWLEIVYTSGTTGDPKGVIITHDNLVSNTVAMKRAVAVRSDQTFLSLLPLSHLFEQNPGFLAPLSSGCTVVYMRGLRPNLIFKVLSEVRVTNMIIVPRLLKLFESSSRREAESQGKTKTFEKLLRFHTPWRFKKILFRPVHERFGKHFEYFISGGAPLSEELSAFWQALGFRITQGYGLTECSPVLTINTWQEAAKGSVGKVVPGVELKINQGGEIYAWGPNITQGYFQKPDQTKELFDNEWMKTGDMGTIDSNGYLFLKGRKKDVIVTGAGMNVYPEDIEAVLLRQKGVKDVCVLGLASAQGEQVHAEVLLADPKASIKTIIKSANQELNDAQQITSYSIWPNEDFPRTTTMKIKKPLVLAQVLGTKAAGSTQSLPSNMSKLYSLIARACEVNAHDVTPSSTLASDLHLTSVSRIELIALIEQEFNLDLDEDDITATTTVAQLEDMITKRARVLDANIFRRWLLTPPVRIIRAVFNAIVGDTIIRLFVRRQIIGKENLEGLEGPAIFIANHVGYFDAPSIIMSLPPRIGYKIAPAAWKEYFEDEGAPLFHNHLLDKLLLKFYYLYASIMVNAYPFPKKTGFKRSLEYTGELLDKGWNILFFPEGEHSPSGELQPFRSGIGWIVKEMKVPIVPIKHNGFENIMAGDQHQLPRFGKAIITIGKPVMMDDRKSIPELTNELQTILKNL